MVGAAGSLEAVGAIDHDVLPARKGEPALVFSWRKRLAAETATGQARRDVPRFVPLDLVDGPGVPVRGASQHGRVGRPFLLGELFLLQHIRQHHSRQRHRGIVL